MRTILFMAVSLTCFGCAEHPAPPAQTPSSAPNKPLAAEQADSKSPDRGTVHIADDIRKACGITDADTYFAFDSAKLEAAHQPVLDQLAKCFVSGKLAGRDMRLVGHADPRGSDDYNMVLGGSRADTVKSFLVLRGMPRAHIATTSRGELDASGTNEQSWAEDRRVDVLVRRRAARSP